MRVGDLEQQAHELARISPQGSRVIGVIELVSRRSGSPFRFKWVIAGTMGRLKNKRGKLRDGQRRDRIGVHCIGTARSDLKAHAGHRFIFRTPHRPVRQAGQVRSAPTTATTAGRL
jgi:hypothetical protein